MGKLRRNAVLRFRHELRFEKEICVNHAKKKGYLSYSKSQNSHRFANFPDR